MSFVIKPWLRKPDDLFKCFLIVLPIIASQILPRLYPIIDNRYLSVLGEKALYIHNIQYNFATFGQFVGLATYISCLVFWNRKECLNKQGSILVKHLLLSGFFSFVLAFFGWTFSAVILTKYKVDHEYLSVASVYLKIGLVNMVIQTIYGGLDGMLVGSKQQKLSMYIAIVLVIGNILANHYIVYSLYSGIQNANSYYLPLTLIALSTTVLLSTAIIISFLLVVRRINGWENYPLIKMLPVWWSELGSYLIRGGVPFIYAYQLCFLSTSTAFLVTYQLALHLSYVFCFPLIAAMQVAVRDAAGDGNFKDNVPSWWNGFLYTGLIPTTILLGFGMFFSVPAMRIVYDYVTPVDHIAFLSLFFIGCWVGQIGNAFTIPLRAAKKSYLVTKNFFFAELIFMLGGTQLLIFFNTATSLTLGYVTLLFTSVYCFLNLRDAFVLNRKTNMTLQYEKIS